MLSQLETWPVKSQGCAYFPEGLIKVWPNERLHKATESGSTG